jgi:hypothetical protein
VSEFIRAAYRGREDAPGTKRRAQTDG